ncbi:MAG: hypothetical protein K0V04_43730 [Deltaproteobacteria bacterium]|nr:hypothetical protein [Deltaproteobacteria bacterium]
MDKKRIIIPATAAIGLLLTACADPIVGEWELRSLNGQRWPDVYNYDGCTYRATMEADVDEDLDVRLVQTYTNSGDCDGYDGVYTYIYSGDVDVEDKRKKYEITLFADYDSLLLDCKLDKRKDELECDDIEHNDQYKWERK